MFSCTVPFKASIRKYVCSQMEVAVACCVSSRSKMSRKCLVMHAARLKTTKKVKTKRIPCNFFRFMVILS